MAETISIDFADISGDVGTYTAFVRNFAGTLLNTGGDVISEIGATGMWTFTLGETRVVNSHYVVRIYSGASEVAANLVYDGVLYPRQTVVGFDGNLPNRTVGRGTVATGTTSTMTPSEIVPDGAVANQFKGRILVFDVNTVTAGLRGQATDIVSNTSAALPVFTFTTLTTAPAAGDTFSIV